MFNLAFENQHEPGYVTEKPFDALIAGTVPIYKGDSAHLKSLLPHPDAAIFLDDFKDIKSLIGYLTFLSQNETAYERHRAWRHDYTYEGVRHKDYLTDITSQTSPHRYHLTSTILHICSLVGSIPLIYSSLAPTHTNFRHVPPSSLILL